MAFRVGLGRHISDWTGLHLTSQTQGTINNSNNTKLSKTQINFWRFHYETAYALEHSTAEQINLPIVYQSREFSAVLALT
jgi:hypothetical protein